MAKTITLTTEQWDILKAQIVEDYGRTTVMISWRLKDTLGFTVRSHTAELTNDKHWRASCTIRLDFWDEILHTMFLLKYSDYINSTT
jgi:hypothetical protein